MDSKITEITAAQKENAMVDLSDISAVKGKYGEVYEIGTVVDEDARNTTALWHSW